MLYFIISGGETVVYYIVSLVMNDEPEKQFCPLSTEKKNVARFGHSILRLQNSVVLTINHKLQILQKISQLFCYLKLL